MTKVSVETLDKEQQVLAYLLLEKQSKKLQQLFDAETKRLEGNVTHIMETHF